MGHEETPGTPGDGRLWTCPECVQFFNLRPEEGKCPYCFGKVIELPPSNLDSTQLFDHLKEARDAAAADHKPVDNAPAITPDPLIGSELDVYEIHSLIGKGAMGRVYLARHRQLHRLCALKILAVEKLKDELDFVSRFRNEGRAAAALSHPNIVTIHAIGEAEGVHFLEMEFVAGASLQQYIHHGGRMEPIRATALMARIAEGLAAAHREGVIHRDLKPDNVLLTPQHQPKIADFGLAHRIDMETEQRNSERLYGTPRFMAPELFRGGAATPAADVFSLGVMYFFTLTGRFPFDHESLMKVIHAVQNDPLPNARQWCPELPLEMAECLNLLCEKSPENRPHDAVAAALLLNSVLGESRDLESLIREACHDWKAVTISGEGTRFRLELKLGNGRKQNVFIELTRHGKSGSDRLLQIYSVCCAANAEHYEYVLRLNAEILHGGLAIKEFNGMPQFIMVDTYPWSTVDPEEIRRSVMSVATRADGLEQRLSGRDIN